jgi:hypothetical protein
MLEQTVNYLKETGIEDVIQSVKGYCRAVGVKMPEKAGVKLELARRMVLPNPGLDEFQALSVSELQVIKRTVQRAEELREYGERLAAFRALIADCENHVPDQKLSLVAKDLAMRFQPELLLGDSLSPYALDARCENFANDYQSCYIAFHNSWHDEKRKNTARVEKIATLALALDTLDTLMGVDVPRQNRRKHELSALQNLCSCEDLGSHQIGYAAFCPNCGLKFGEVYDWVNLPRFEAEVRRQLEEHQAKLARRLADALIKRVPDDPLTGIVEAISVSDLSKLPNILTDDVVEALRKILGK